MPDEDIAPSRAELDAFLWVLKNTSMTKEQIQDYTKQYLQERGVSDAGIARTIADLNTYSNYPVGEVSGTEG
jgi:hypothetical protein